MVSIKVPTKDEQPTSVVCYGMQQIKGGSLSAVYIAHIHSDGRVNVDRDTERVHLLSEVWWGPGKCGWDVISDQSEESPTATLLVR